MPDSLTAICADAAADLGMTRPAGQCFAAVWRAAEPPCADDLTAMLGLSRSNVSTALKELRAWGLITVLRRTGDRREFFTAPADPWELLRLILAGRHRRSLAPIIDRLLTAEADAGGARVAALHDAAVRVADWLAALGKMDAAALSRHMESTAENSGKRPADKKKKKKKPKP
jgi:DNA-binding transcriptional regulator GbsR (MarR family)